MTIIGRSLALRPLERADLELKVRWINDPAVHANLHYEIPLRLARTEAWFRGASRDPARRDFVIETRPEGRPIGLIGLLHIDLRNRSAEIYIAIGEPEFWGKGVMLEAERLMIRWAFDWLELEKIWAQTRATNVASIVTMKKLGFQVEGLLRQEFCVKGGRVDIVRVGLLRREFKDDREPPGGPGDQAGNQGET